MWLPKVGQFIRKSKVPKKIELTLRARQDYLRIIEYLSKNWTVKEIERFEEKFLKALSTLETHPKAFILSRKNTQKFVFDKHNIIHYRIKGDIIEVLTIWPGKRNPNKLKF